MRTDRDHLLDILDSARLLQQYAQGKSEEDFLADVQLQDSMVRRLEIMGEAAQRLSAEQRARLGDIQWRLMVGMRNVLVHDYDDVNLTVVWDTVFLDVPRVIGVLEKHLGMTSQALVGNAPGLVGVAPFLVLDGPEGCGKSTQIKLLKKRLDDRGAPAVVVRDPGTTKIGEQIRNILLHPDHGEMGMRCEMLLYMAARAQMMHEVILPALRGGTSVLCDRFVSSTLAYQLGGDGLSAADIRGVADIAIGGRWPDLVLILDIAPERGFARVQREKDRIEQRPLEYHRKVRENFLAQASADPQRYRVVNADASPEQVSDEIWRLAGPLWAQR